MENDYTVTWILVGFLAVLCMYAIFEVLLPPYKSYRLKKRIRCLFGKHDAGPVRDAVGGRRVQRCDWCDKVVREYQVTVNEAKQTIRRIY